MMGCGGKTDEQKMRVTYKEIADYIETGKTENKKSQEIIEKMHKASEHKRNLIPTYQRKNN